MIVSERPWTSKKSSGERNESWVPVPRRFASVMEGNVSILWLLFLNCQIRVVTSALLSSLVLWQSNEMLQNCSDRAKSCMQMKVLWSLLQPVNSSRSESVYLISRRHLITRRHTSLTAWTQTGITVALRGPTRNSRWGMTLLPDDPEAEGWGKPL